eukprot:GHVL01028430.1.p2 GENE.GHVL01028430.1~~GHVL01028430.1.p2  ORF type:complete len:163 (-),score=35.22 GHVL01028430.1:148-636(-)
MGLLGTETRGEGCYVKGRLQPTRSFGDFYLKKEECKYDEERERSFLDVPASYPYITADPQITVRERTIHDEFVILASDGLWDELTDDEAVKIVKNRFKLLKTVDKEAAQNAAQALVLEALDHAAKKHVMTINEMAAIPAGNRRRNLHDDITVIVIPLTDNNR